MFPTLNSPPLDPPPPESHTKAQTLRALVQVHPKDHSCSHQQARGWDVRTHGRRGCRRCASRDVLLHICPEKKGGSESPAFCYFYFLVRGAICAGLSLSGGNRVADEIQIQAHFAGCHAGFLQEPGWQCWCVFFNSISTCQGPAAVHVGPSSSPTATAATVLSAKAQKASDRQSSGGNRCQWQRGSGDTSDAHTSTMALPRNPSM